MIHASPAPVLVGTVNFEILKSRAKFVRFGVGLIAVKLKEEILCCEILLLQFREQKDPMLSKIVSEGTMTRTVKVLG